MVHFTVCFVHVTYAFQSESTLYDHTATVLVLSFIATSDFVLRTSYRFVYMNVGPKAAEFLLNANK